MKRKVTMLFVLLCTAVFFSIENTPYAQQQSQPPQSQSPQQPAAEPEEALQPAEIENPANTPEDTDLILADIDPDADQDEDALGNRRFIPTEEISQDLGVSFPVDI